jgi:hypothetical protein
VTTIYVVVFQSIVSADDFFVDPSGSYIYLPNLVSKAHDWAQAKAKKAMKQPNNRIVVADNTNTKVRQTNWLDKRVLYCLILREKKVK